MNIENTIKPVLVTALYDIDRDKWDDYHQSYDTYLKWMENILCFDSHLVVFTEKKFYENIIDIRKKYDENLSKTIIIIRNFEDLEFYNLFYGKVQTVMNDQTFLKKIIWKVPEQTKPKYNIIIFNKLSFIEESFTNNYFEGNFFIWLDAGVLREKKYGKIIYPSTKKINNYMTEKITFFSHNLKFIMPEPKEHILAQYRNIHGGCFFVPSLISLKKLKKDFINKIEEFLNFGLVGSEEKYLDLICKETPSDYNIIQKGWRDYFEDYI